MIKLPSTPLALSFPLMHGSVLFFDDVRPMCVRFSYDEQLRKRMMADLSEEGRLLMMLLNTGVGLISDDMGDAQKMAEFTLELMRDWVNLEGYRPAIADQALAVRSWLNLPESTPLRANWISLIAVVSNSSINAKPTES
jgi:hypothetical protein